VEESHGRLGSVGRFSPSDGTTTGTGSLKSVGPVDATSPEHESEQRPNRAIHAHDGDGVSPTTIKQYVYLPIPPAFFTSSGLHLAISHLSSFMFGSPVSTPGVSLG